MSITPISRAAAANLILQNTHRSQGCGIQLHIRIPSLTEHPPNSGCSPDTTELSLQKPPQPMLLHLVVLLACVCPFVFNGGVGKRVYSAATDTWVQLLCNLPFIPLCRLSTFLRQRNQGHNAKDRSKHMADPHSQVD